MAKKKKDRTRADAVRAAVDQAFQATADRAEQTQKAAEKRVQDTADEVTAAFNRLREALDDARPVSHADLAAIQAELKSLGTRIAKLESAAKPAPAAKPAATRKPAARKPAARKPAATPASKVPAARAAAKRASATRKPATS